MRRFCHRVRCSSCRSGDCGQTWSRLCWRLNSSRVDQACEQVQLLQQKLVEIEDQSLVNLKLVDSLLEVLILLPKRKHFIFNINVDVTSRIYVRIKQSTFGKPCISSNLRLERCHVTISNSGSRRCLDTQILSRLVDRGDRSIQTRSRTSCYRTYLNTSCCGVTSGW